MNKQPKWKSKVAWAAVFAFLSYSAKQMFPSLQPHGQAINIGIDLFLIALTTLGIFNNPDDSENY